MEVAAASMGVGAAPNKTVESGLDSLFREMGHLVASLRVS